MARPRAFDEDRVLDAAMECFWGRGLEATSIRDLSAEMGINCPSLYNAFGDKRALFALALERYATCFMRERIGRLERHPSPKQAIRIYLDEVIERSLTDPQQRGCFIVNSAMDVPPDATELRAAVCGYLTEIEGFFRGRLEAALALGEIPATIAPEPVGRLFFAVMLGIRVAARARPERALLEDMARPALALLDHPAPESMSMKGKP